jgi:hypothetical protein
MYKELKGKNNNMWEDNSNNEKLQVTVHTSRELSILTIHKNQNSKSLANELLENNSKIHKLHS